MAIASTNPPAPSRTAAETNIKDTIESILVAFMLAFIFRAFVVEAFVIPTGSMAPTLLGAHMRYRCPDCGYRFDTNFSGTDRGDDIDIPSQAGAGHTAKIACPNCGYRFLPGGHDDVLADTTNTPVHYGDRILVLKYLYMFQDPKRWDVVVFKAPVDPKHFDYTQNYIKRLVGKPGESIMILDGDIYVGHGEDKTAFEVQRKPEYAQNALWRIVYDNDYYPRGLDRTVYSTRDPKAFVQPWKLASGGGWTLGAGKNGDRGFSFNNDAAGVLAFDPSSNPYAFPLTDWLAYNEEMHAREGYVPSNNVSDVKLAFNYQRQSGNGPLRAELTKLDHKFVAEILPDRATLFMDDKAIAGPFALPAAPEAHAIEFSNYDYGVTLKVDGQTLCQTTPQQYRPDIARLLEAFNAGRPLPKPTIHLSAAGQQCALSHIQLLRDIFYINNIDRATASGTPRNISRLGADEFFVCGDNSEVSLDARYWEDPINLPEEGLNVRAGVVPRRFMLGKAFFVYWPAGFRPPAFPTAPSVIPNFGELREIH